MTFTLGFEAKISQGDIIEVISHLCIIVRSALPLSISMKELALESDSKSLQKMLNTMADKIDNGHSLSESLQEFHKYFGFATIFLVRIGEETGSLELALEKAKAFLLQSYKFRRDFKMALIYPLTILTVATAAIMVWFSFVMPQMSELFLQMDIELPPLTKFLMFVSETVTMLFPYFILAIVLLTTTVYTLNKRSKRMQLFFSKKVLTLPIIGKFLKDLNTAYISEFLHQSLLAGTPIYKALMIISENISNVTYQNSLKNVLLSLEQGESLSVSLQKEKLYNAFTIRMLNIGEKSGDLNSQLYTISDYYKQKIEQKVITITKVIEPALIIFIGAVFALVMVGLMGPIFDIVSKT